MLRTFRVRIIPTPEQEKHLYKCAGVSRWAYNYFIGVNKDQFEKFKKGDEKEGYINQFKVRKHINNDLKPTTHTWLKEVSSSIMKQAVRDADKNYQMFFKGLYNRPGFKSRKTHRPSFYVNYETLRRTPRGFIGERLGELHTSERLPKIPKGERYSDPRIKYDGEYWYLTAGYKIREENLELTSEVLGIDLGVSKLAVCSDGKVYENINKTSKMKRLEKKLKKEQRRLSRKRNIKKEKYPIKDVENCKNIQKQKKKVLRIYRRMTDIRVNHLHQVTTEIVKTKPSKIVMEDLDVKGLMKNKLMSKLLREQSLRRFRDMVEYKSEAKGIEFELAGRYFPSSKLCSGCHTKKETIGLDERVYKCESCGSEIDRDYNASLNIKNYSYLKDVI